MDWTIVALTQMLVLTIGITTGLILRLRAMRKENDLLRDHGEACNATIAELEEKQAKFVKPEQWIADKIKSLDTKDPFSGLSKLFFEHASKPKPLDEFEPAVLQAVQEAGLVPKTEDYVEEDLKSLVQKFTQDSREMMICIQNLEQENEGLIKQIAALSSESNKDDSPTPEAEAQSSEPENETELSEPEAQDASEPSQVETESAGESTDTPEEPTETDTAKDADSGESPDTSDLRAEIEAELAADAPPDEDTPTPAPPPASESNSAPPP